MTVTPKQLEKYFEVRLEAEVGPYSVKRILETEKEKTTLVDVRGSEDFAREHIHGAISIPLNELDKRRKELSKKNRIITYCSDITCGAAPKAALLLAKKGFRVSHLYGGIAE